MKVRRALLSVSDKTGIVEFAQGLARLGVELYSTGGTQKALEEAGVPVKSVSQLTGFPEILAGRVKTLHPKVAGGILARRNVPEDLAQLAEHGILPIDLVAVNLYPFAQTIAKSGVTIDEACEQIDIGGPTMVRAAAKNWRHVAVVVNPARYPEILAKLEKGSLDEDLTLALAQEAFSHTASYDMLIAGYLAKQAAPSVQYPQKLFLEYEKVCDLRYGENPHQQAAFYRETNPEPLSLAQAQQLHGKELSFNNINDANGAISLLAEFAEPTAVAVKHTNPCGVAAGKNIYEAYLAAYNADPVSIFGGIVALNRPVDAATAEELSKIFLEIVIAPEFSPEAMAILTKKKNLRLLALPALAGNEKQDFSIYSSDLKKVAGGLLLQEQDTIDLVEDKLQVVTKKAPTDAEWEELRFAWKVVKHVKSNAIVLAKDLATVGVGAGQMNRIDAARIAIAAAGEKAEGSVLASDAFFPFPDVVEEASRAGISAIIQPGGSIRDEESIKLADERGIAMVFTGIRHFKH
ncbi:MAG: bifunctional phosphoribosylaminoimidazolecarboxamide formyltransferase/IMP cyclohydrolase [Firmicutes bacterium]|jgi:phosphoribosylaminoimidazolecarboxamide formyltransferase/IMP cyclohydrolase|nr:bifunctional phosphoribosylaminoimidazolecarboxamide formyltransferase/IMP cyclohydrolase [Bacillota bacterium]HQD40584.1 bifunctional phosphoribosylaminoimidazolecarboxamide formyltransferase/IMP cyclohydrolase [Bacillota bacterium]